MDRQPNILLLFPDEHRGDWIPGKEDIPVKMPNLANLMKQGVHFTRAVTPSPFMCSGPCLSGGGM